MQTLNKLMPSWGQSCDDIDYLDIELWRRRMEHLGTEKIIALLQLAVIRFLQETKELAWDGPIFVSREILTPTEIKPFPSILSKYADNQVIDMLSERDNPYLYDILCDALYDIEKFIKNKRPDGKINLVIKTEPEHPKTRWITIVLRTDFKDFEEQMTVWKEVQNRIQTTVNLYLEEAKLEKDQTQIKVANALIAVSVT